MKIPTFLLAAGADTSAAKEYWQYLVDFYINNKTDYEILDFGGVMSVPLLIIILFAVIAVAAIALIFVKKLNGDLVRTLIQNECLSAETAKSLPELDLADKLFLRYSVKKGTALRRFVICKEEEEYDAQCQKKAEEYAKMREENPKLSKYFSPKPFKIDPDAHHFYIPEDKKYAAEVRFEQKGNATVGAIILGAVALVVLAALVIFLPDLLKMLDEFLVSFLS